jgi:hypothetical protein
MTPTAISWTSAERQRIEVSIATEATGRRRPADSAEEAFFFADFFAQAGEAFDLFFEPFDPFFEPFDLARFVAPGFDFFADPVDFAAQFFDLAFDRPEFLPGRLARRPLRPLLADVPARSPIPRRPLRPGLRQQRQPRPDRRAQHADPDHQRDELVAGQRHDRLLLRWHASRNSRRRGYDGGRRTAPAGG